MALRQRLGRLEEKHAAKSKPEGIHVHYEEENPRETCPVCRMMTDAEHAHYLKHGDGRPFR